MLFCNIKIVVSFKIIKKFKYNITIIMGICLCKSEGEGYDISSLRKDLFEYKYAVGRGGFGKVWRVSTRRIAGEDVTEFALKEM